MADPYAWILTVDQRFKLHDWMKTLPELSNLGSSIGGRITYCFTPTGLGDILVVKDSVSGQEINLTDFESW